MRFFYDTCPVHDLGEFTVSQRREAEGGPDSPQRIKVTTTLALTTFADGYAANANLLYERTDFDLTFADRLTGIAGVLELSLSEEVTYTAPRWVLLPALATPSNPLGLDVPQTFSTASGSRKVSGSVTAATLATAETWAKKQRALLTGDADGVEVFEPESWNRETVYLARTENVQLYRVRFTFTEKLINYPAP